MLDIRYIRENAKLVAEKSKQKGFEVDIKKLLELDSQKRKLLGGTESIRAERNQVTEAAKGQKPSDKQVAKGKELKEKLAKLEAELEPVEKELTILLNAVPNMPTDDVPVGSSEDENVEVKTWGDKPKFDFEPKKHWEIAKAKGWLDSERAVKVAGNRFVYVKGDLV